MHNYVRIIITGKNPKYYFNRYIFNKISYTKYKIIDYKTIEVNILYDDYIRLKNIKSTYDIKVINKFGLIKYKYLIKNNYTFVISFFISMIFLFLISNTIFNIQIIHNDKNIRLLLKEELIDNKIEILKIVPDYKKRKSIIKKIMNNNKEKIEWLEIERKGSKLIVKATERRINKKEDSNTPRHIVAKKTGIIRKIEASNGVILKKKDDYVQKNDIIVSGDIIKDDTVKGQVRAKGIVYAETWYSVNIIYPLNYKQVIYKDDVRNNVVINFFNRDYALRKNFFHTSLEKSHVLIKSKVIPFNIRIEKQRKIKIINKKYSKNKALKMALKIAEDKIRKKLKKDEYIIDKKTLNLFTFDSRIEVDVFFKVYENITDYKEVDSLILENTIE